MGTLGGTFQFANLPTFFIFGRVNKRRAVQRKRFQDFVEKPDVHKGGGTVGFRKDRNALQRREPSKSPRSLPFSTRWLQSAFAVPVLVVKVGYFREGGEEERD